MRRVALVSGCTGQTGSYLCELLVEKGYTVYGLVRRSSTSNITRLSHVVDKMNIIYGDITDSKSVFDAVKSTNPDELYNLAAQSFVPMSWNSPSYTFSVNTLGYINILEAVRLNSPHTKVYQASSSEMYGNSKSGFMPKSPYGISKLASHWLSDNYRTNYDMYICSGIAFNHESPRRGQEFVTQKIATFVRNFDRKSKLKLGNLHARRDWGYAKDYALAMWLILQQSKPDDYVIATGKTYSVRDFCNEAFKCTNVGNWEEFVETDSSLVRPNEVNVLCGDPTKVMSLGWKPTVTFEELVRMMVNA